MVTTTDSLKDDPRFKQGISLMKSKKFDEASEQFGELLTIMVTEENELFPQFAPVYFQYGNALLSQLESNVDDNSAFEAALALAAKSKLEKDETSIESKVRTIEADEEREKKTAELSKIIEEDNKKRAEEEEEKEIAWNNLELARIIYSKLDCPSTQEILDLARIHDRLADLYTLNSNDIGAVGELEIEISLLEKSLPPTCEHIIDIRLKLMLSYCACAGQTDSTPQFVLKYRNLALNQGTLVLQGLNSLVSRVKTSLDHDAKESDGNEIQEKGNITQEKHRLLELDGGGSKEEKERRLQKFQESLTDVEQLCAHIKDEIQVAQREGTTQEGFDSKVGNEEIESSEIDETKVAPAMNVLEVKKKRRPDEKKDPASKKARVGSIDDKSTSGDKIA